MRFSRILMFGCFLVIGASVLQAQEQSNNQIKKGWNFGVLPALGYDSNLGLLYGGIINMFDYGDGSRYPDFDHNLYLQLSAYTKGSMDAILFFDSYALIPNKHFIGRFSYNRNRAYPFHGFNGVQTIYNPDYETFGTSDFISQVYYKLDRSLLKADFLVEDKIAGTKFNWIAGLDLAWYKVSTVDIEHLNKGKEGDELIPNVPILYDYFLDWNLIKQEIKDGGFDNSLKFGLVYNSRDRLTNPMRGIWTEMLIRLSPTFIGNPNNFARISLIHRQYFTIVDEKLSFAYRLWYEGTFGDVPFYSRQHLTASNYFEGFGGAQTVRGVMLNRVVGQHSAIGNFEFRWKAFRFNLIGQNFYIGFNAFMDAGTVLKGYKMDFTNVSDIMRDRNFNLNYMEIYTTAGAGLKLVMNENFVVSADYGKSMSKNYGTTGLYVMIGYIF